MKKRIGYLSVAILSLGLFFASCKKKDSTADTSSQYKVESDDQARFTNESDAVANDANTAVESFTSGFSGRPLTPTNPLVCDATIVNNPATSSITITYNGGTCTDQRRTRTGVVVISYTPGSRWRDAGSSFTVTYQNLKITRVSDGKSITINGSKIVKNVSGGRLIDLTAGNSVTHTITSSGMTITFDDGTQRTWAIAKQRVFTKDNNGIIITTTGIAPQGGGIAEWGINRYNNEFSNAITQPLILKEACSTGYHLVSGQTQHVGPVVTITTTFGTDVTGNGVATCPLFFFKSVWTGPNGNSYTYIAPY